MTRPSNTITDLFTGYALELLATNSSSINISATENTSTLEGYIQDFVNSYNSYINVDALSATGNSLSTSGPLVSDATVSRIQRTLRTFSTQSITGYEGGPYSASLLGISTQRDGTLSFNTTTFKNTLEVNSNIITAFFTDNLTTDSSSVTVSGLSSATVPGSYALAKSGSDYTLAGVTLSANGSTYTSSSGDTSGMTLNISDTTITSANIYYGESLLSKIDDSLSQLLTFNGDIENRLTNLRDNLSDIPNRQSDLDERISKLTERYAIQYSSMEGIVAGLKDTGDMITKMLEKND